jgi:hypothetical protein
MPVLRAQPEIDDGLEKDWGLGYPTLQRRLFMLSKLNSSDAQE